MSEHKKEHHPVCNYCNDKKEILVEHEPYYDVARCYYCKSLIIIKNKKQPKSTPTLQELDEDEVLDFVEDYLGEARNDRGSELIYKVCQAVARKFGTKIEPSKEVTEVSVEEITKILRDEDINEYYSKDFILVDIEETAQAIHDLITRTPNAKNNEG